MQNDATFWHPFRPGLRWPMRLLGIALLLGILAEGVFRGHWRWQSLFLPLAFVIWSFQTPVLRPRPRFYWLGVGILCALLLALLAVIAVSRG